MFGMVDFSTEQGYPPPIFLRIVDELKGVIGRARAKLKTVLTHL